MSIVLLPEQSDRRLNSSLFEPITRFWFGLAVVAGDS